jgi:hypothetical membrane protein
MQMNLALRRVGAYSGILGGILYVVISTVNMLVYPGGYSFFENYFSELGLTMVGSLPNLHGWILFSAACTSAAVCIVPFCLAMREEFAISPGLKLAGTISSLLGILAAPFLSALAIFAADIYLLQHGISTLLFFLLYASSIIIYSIATLFNKEYNNLYSLAGFIVAAAALIHILFVHTALMQKIAVYSLVLWSVVQGYALLQKLKSEPGEQPSI